MYEKINLYNSKLTPWQYSPDGHKPPLVRFHSQIFSVLEGQVANLLPIYNSKATGNCLI
jgi:hypothetical protein